MNTQFEIETSSLRRSACHFTTRFLRYHECFSFALGGVLLITLSEYRWWSCRAVCARVLSQVACCNGVVISAQSKEYAVLFTASCQTKSSRAQGTWNWGCFHLPVAVVPAEVNYSILGRDFCFGVAETMSTTVGLRWILVHSEVFKKQIPVLPKTKLEWTQSENCLFSLLRTYHVIEAQVLRVASCLWYFKSINILRFPHISHFIWIYCALRRLESRHFDTDQKNWAQPYKIKTSFLMFRNYSSKCWIHELTSINFLITFIFM